MSESWRGGVINPVGKSFIVSLTEANKHDTGHMTYAEVIFRVSIIEGFAVVDEQSHRYAFTMDQARELHRQLGEVVKE